MVKVLSENQIQYLLRKCSEEGKTLAPLELSKTVQADVYYDASEMNKVLKLCKKNQYVKVQPGITLLELGNAISKELPSPSVPLTYPSALTIKNSSL